MHLGSLQYAFSLHSIHSECITKFVPFFLTTGADVTIEFCSNLYPMASVLLENLVAIPIIKYVITLNIPSHILNPRFIRKYKINKFIVHVIEKIICFMYSAALRRANMPSPPNMGSRLIYFNGKETVQCHLPNQSQGYLLS